MTTPGSPPRVPRDPEVRTRRVCPGCAYSDGVDNVALQCWRCGEVWEAEAARVPAEPEATLDLKRKEPRVPDVPLEGGPYAIGSDHWPGLSKLIEEAGEVIQVAGKILGTGGDAHHWDGTDLRDRLEEELADMLAAIAHVTAKNGLDKTKIRARAQAKTELFKTWAARVGR